MDREAQIANARKRDVEARAHDTALVDAAVELDDNRARAVVVDLLELVDLREVPRAERLAFRPHWARQVATCEPQSRDAVRTQAWQASRSRETDARGRTRLVEETEAPVLVSFL